MAGLPPMVFPAVARHTATVIFAHGLGDQAGGWASMVENWRRRQRMDEVKFVLPNAPDLAITANWGHKMPAWYDIDSLDGPAEKTHQFKDEKGILNSQKYFHSLVQAEIDAGISSERIVLGGFSQGAAISIFSGLTAKAKLAGIVALSGYLLLSSKLEDLVPQPELNKETPIFMAHGSRDNVINVKWAAQSYDTLKEMGYKAEWHLYKNMVHTASTRELRDVEDFLQERLPALGGAGGGSNSTTATAGQPQAGATAEGKGKGKGKPEL